MCPPPLVTISLFSMSVRLFLSRKYKSLFWRKEFPAWNSIPSPTIHQVWEWDIHFQFLIISRKLTLHIFFLRDLPHQWRSEPVLVPGHLNVTPFSVRQTSWQGLLIPGLLQVSYAVPLCISIFKHCPGHLLCPLNLETEGYFRSVLGSFIGLFLGLFQWWFSYPYFFSSLFQEPLFFRSLTLQD